MSKPEFNAGLELILSEDARYARDAYFFLRDALEHTVKQRKKNKEGGTHVSGQQLLEGIRHYSLRQFGPMATTVFDFWGVQRCEDFGAMVFNLVRVGLFGKTDHDSMADFKGGYTFHEAFVAPYQPALPTPLTRRRAAGEPAGELS